MAFLEFITFDFQKSDCSNRRFRTIRISGTLRIVRIKQRRKTAWRRQWNIDTDAIKRSRERLSARRGELLGGPSDFDGDSLEIRIAVVNLLDEGGRRALNVLLKRIGEFTE